jgi:hypothetical protein
MERIRTEVCHLSVRKTRNRSQCSADASVKHRPIWVCLTFTNGTYNGTSSDIHHLYCPGICRRQLPHHKKSQVRSGKNLKASAWSCCACSRPSSHLACRNHGSKYTRSREYFIFGLILARFLLNLCYGGFTHRPLYNTVQTTFRRIQDRHVGFSPSQERIGVLVPEELVDELLCLP